MTNTEKKWLGIVVAVGIGLTVPAEASEGLFGWGRAKWYVSPTFGDTETRPQVLVVLPPQAELIKRKAVVTESMMDEALKLEVAAASATQNLLTSKGYIVTQLTTDLINANPELQDLMVRVNNRYSEEWPKIIRKPKRVRYGRYNMGEELQSLANELGADAIVFTRIQGVEVSIGGAIVGALLLRSPKNNSSFARMDVSVINGQNAKVEAYFDGQITVGMNDLTKKSEKTITKLTKKALKKYPDSTKAIKVKISKKELAQLEEVDADDDAILAELEALLGEQSPAIQ